MFIQEGWLSWEQIKDTIVYNRGGQTAVELSENHVFVLYFYCKV